MLAGSGTECPNAPNENEIFTECKCVRYFGAYGPNDTTLHTTVNYSLRLVAVESN